MQVPKGEPSDQAILACIRPHDDLLVHMQCAIAGMNSNAFHDFSSQHALLPANMRPSDSAASRPTYPACRFTLLLLGNMPAWQAYNLYASGITLTCPGMCTIRALLCSDTMAHIRAQDAQQHATPPWRMACTRAW